jgi:hypothetical protein
MKSCTGIMSNCEHRGVGFGRMMSLAQGIRDELAWNLRRWVGGGVCGGDVLPDAGEAANGGICIAENVSGMRADYAASEGGLHGVREGAGERSGGAGGSGMSGRGGSDFSSDLELSSGSWVCT